MQDHEANRKRTRDDTLRESVCEAIEAIGATSVVRDTVDARWQCCSQIFGSLLSQHSGKVEFLVLAVQRCSMALLGFVHKNDGQSEDFRFPDLRLYFRVR